VMKEGEEQRMQLSSTIEDLQGDIRRLAEVKKDSNAKNVNIRQLSTNSIK